jgi:hypothetical protein
MPSDMPDPWHVPFQRNWRAPEHWRDEMRRDPAAVRRALEGLGRLLPDQVVFGRDWSGHQAAADYILLRERWRLLEVGAMVANLSSLGDYRERFLDPAKYHAACAELRVGLMLQRSGFEVTRDPVNTGRRARETRSGPDWCARSADRAFGVEVKCPGDSDSAIGRIGFGVHVVETAMRLLPSDKPIRLAFNPATVASATAGRWFDKARAETLVLDALAEAETDGTSATELGAVAPGTPGFSPEIRPIPLDHEAETRRLRDTVHDAALQAHEFGEPGLVVLDSSLDRNLMRCCREIADLTREDWASELAAVLLVAPTCPGVAVTFVVGPRFDVLASASLPGLRRCTGEHLHVDTFGRPSPVCDLDTRFENYPPFCFAGQGHCASHL